MLVGYEKGLHLTDEIFDGMRASADLQLQKLLSRLIDKDEDSGSLTIKIDVNLEKNLIDNFDPFSEDEKRWALIPIFDFKIGTSMRMKTEVKQSFNGAGLELYFDEDTGEYILKPIANTTQRSFFDGDYTEVNEDVNEGNVKLLEKKGE